MKQRDNSVILSLSTGKKPVLTMSIVLSLAFILVLTMTSCTKEDAPEVQVEVPPSFSDPFVTKELIVLTRNAPTTYYEGPLYTEGFEHDLAIAFAERLGMHVTFVFRETITEILAALEAGEAHFAAAGLTLTPERAGRFLVGPPYHEVRQQLIGRRGALKPRTMDQLIGTNLVVTANSSYADRLRELKEVHPDLTWTETDSVGTEQLMHRVWSKHIDYTVADDNIVSINRRYFPELLVAFHLTDPQELVWYFHPEADSVWGEACHWFEEYVAGGQLKETEEKYYGYIEQFDYVDTRQFIRRIDDRLPKYRELFEMVADEHSIRWTIPAAVAYQESHWNPKARSPTGVRGMMMLSLPTAKELGVTNRLDPEQSVRGGVKYLLQLFERLPESITVIEDRIWIALASYNVGLGHVRDARTLARRLGKDPDRWHDLSEVLPLLAQREYYKTVKYGYARGYEPVLYVNRIRNYEDILRQYLGYSDE